MELQDLIVSELVNTHSLAALIYLIEQGRELEFTLNGEAYFISRDQSQRAVSLWGNGREQSFDRMEELLEKAVASDRPFLAAWAEAQIETLF